MPRLVGDAVGIAARTGEPETKIGRVLLQPAELRGGRERLGQRGSVGRAEVDSAPGVVLAVAGSGDAPEDGIEGFAGRQFVPNDGLLAVDGAETRERDE